MFPGKYFDRHEFTCKCGCGSNTVDAELLHVLDELRVFFNKPVIVLSGFRCPQHNMAIGGSPTSQHMLGKAADITVKYVSPIQVYEYLKRKYPHTYGLGYYNISNFIHVDVRRDEARWTEKKTN